MRYLLLFLLLALQTSVFGYSANSQLKNAAQKVLISVKSDLKVRSHIDFKYQGQYEDSETGLYYNRFRYYSPESGTYISQDPIRLEGGMPNMYSYVVNLNSLTDPLGLMAIVTIPIAGATPEPGGRQTGINRAWGQERDLVNRGGGTRAWTPSERAIIQDPGPTSRIASRMSRAGYTGHHINNAASFPNWTGDGRNIVFLQNGRHPSGFNEHLHATNGHGGAYRNQTTGDLIDRPNCS
jgi:RHS repeat-associated protein